MKLNLKVTILILGLGLSSKSHALWCISSETFGANFQCKPWVFMTPMCAPEVQEGNLAATERVLNELAHSELKNAPRFKAYIEKVSKLEAKDKVAAYARFAGVNSDADLVQLIGAREVDSRYVQTLSLNAQISEDQAKLVLLKLSSALLGRRH